ncbi:PAS domain-containing protein [Methylobacterium komagatae]|uniref:PAS domain-containing protein n=1 Tax=Methylobacterium komagatae TaxID=374425 RepID=A0ABW2BR09_9HYPH
MHLIDLVRHLADPLEVGVLVTDAELGRPGPTILYANDAFAQMSGYEVRDVLGRTPRILQGAGTSREGVRQVQRALRTEGRFVGRLQNYRMTGEPYLCELDIRPIQGLDGHTEAYIAFEREVVRRRGRPTEGGAGRYKAVGLQEAGIIPFLKTPMFG